MNIRLGLFDSGVGGFTVLKRVIERHGDLECVYLGDLARMPYGAKSISEIRTIAFEVIDWLNEQDLSAVLVACNTTNSLALDIVKQHSKVPVFDLIGSSCDLIEDESRIGVLATPSTVSSKSYSRHITDIDSSISVTEEECPEFVQLIESGNLNSCELRQVAQKHIEELLKADVEAIILGCSHYPLILPLLTDLLPSHIRLIDPAVALAKKLDQFSEHRKSSSVLPKFKGEINFCVTSEPDLFASKAIKFLGFKPEIESISLRYMTKVF